MLRFPSWRKARAVFPPCLSPITLGNNQQKEFQEKTIDRNKQTNRQREREREGGRDWKGFKFPV